MKTNKTPGFRNAEAATGGAFLKKFLKISQILQKKTSVGSLINKFGNFIKKRLQHRFFVL